MSIYTLYYKDPQHPKVRNELEQCAEAIVKYGIEQTASKCYIEALKTFKRATLFWKQYDGNKSGKLICKIHFYENRCYLSMGRIKEMHAKLN